MILPWYITIYNDIYNDMYVYIYIVIYIVKGNEMKQHVQHAVLKQHAVTAKHWLKRMEKRDASC